MHIPDGVLSGPVLVSTALLAAGGVAAGLRKMDYEHVPRVGVLSAVFFVASLVHVDVGVSSAHLLLPGLIGVMLGWEAFPALAAALLLQAIFFGFGGITSLGTNVLDMALPAVVCWYAFAPAIRRSGNTRRAFVLSFAAGVTGVALGCVLVTVVLVLSGREFTAAAAALFAAHIPVMAAEGFITAAAVTFLLKVRPDLVGPRRAVPLFPGVEG